MCARVTEWTVIHKSKICRERMKQKGKNKIYHSPINFFESKTPPRFSMLFLAYADFILHHLLPDKWEAESFQELKDCRKRSDFMLGRQKRNIGEKDKALILQSDNTPTLMRQLDQHHHAI